MPDELNLDALLESIASREQVDWRDAESRSANPKQRARLQVLRDVARLDEFHQTLQRDVGPAADPKVVERWGDLLLLERVGSGASGEVFRAWDPALQREVALKLMRRDKGASDSADWLEEARALARVRNPHVVTVFGAAEHDGRAGLWMEFLRGPTLEAEIARRGALPAAEVARLGAQLGSALETAHATGTLHRDVKPANVALEPDVRAVLMDFGLGQRHSAERAASPFSGTPLFMSPRRLAGAQATPADDIYALGVTLWCALAGAPPYRAESLNGLRAAVEAGPDRRLREMRPDASPALIAAIEHAMAPNPEQRFASAGTLASAFRAAAAESAASPPTSRPAWVTMAIAAGVIVAIGLVWVAASRRPTSTPQRPATATAAPSVTAYDVAASFVRRGRDGDVHLESGDRVGPGDEISLEFRASRTMWVYVLDADDRGESYLLFPQPMFDRSNPLPPQSTIVLPGTRAGRENAWTVTSRGGREHLLIVANPTPVAELEAELGRLPAPVPGRAVSYARIGTQTLERLRGMGGVSEVPEAVSTPGPAQIFERIRSLAGSEQGVHGTWVRQVTLENPLR